MKALKISKIKELIKENFSDIPRDVKDLLEIAMILASSETVKYNKDK